MKKASGNLDYLPAGQSEDFVTELIDGHRMDELLTSLRDTYDLVIFDTAPATRIIDTVHLAEKTDATVIITRSGKTHPEDLEATIKRLPKEKIIGFVINDFKKSDIKFAATSKHYGYNGKGYQNYKAQY